MRHSALALAAVATLVLSACGTQMKVAEVDQKTGLIKSERGEVKQATVVTAKAIPLSAFSGTAFISNGGEFASKQLKATQLFKDVLTYDDMQKVVVTNNLSDKVASLNEPIGLSRLAKAYKPFLWVHFKQTSKEGKTFLQMIGTNPENLEDVFVAEIHLDFVWAGVNDQNSRYPLYNAFSEWARKNS